MGPWLSWRLRRWRPIGLTESMSCWKMCFWQKRRKWSLKCWRRFTRLGRRVRHSSISCKCRCKRGRLSAKTIRRTLRRKISPPKRRSKSRADSACETTTTHESLSPPTNNQIINFQQVPPQAFQFTKNFCKKSSL